MYAFLGIIAMLLGYLGLFGLGTKTMLLAVCFFLLQICKNQSVKVKLKF